jgi:hypothetical protein
LFLPWCHEKIIISIVAKMVDGTQVANAWVGMDTISCNENKIKLYLQYLCS